MPRKRIISIELYFKAKLVKLLGSKGLHLYEILWCIADDWGGYEPDYQRIAFWGGALKFSAKQVEDYISRLIQAKKIIEFRKQGKRIHWIVNFLEHQPLDNPSLPSLPIPDWIDCESCRYQSGKAYAKYTIIGKKLPVGYQSTTGNGVTVTNSNGKETEKKLKRDIASSQTPSTPKEKSSKKTNPDVKVFIDFAFNAYGKQFPGKKLRIVGGKEGKLVKQTLEQKPQGFTLDELQKYYSAFLKKKIKTKDGIVSHTISAFIGFLQTVIEDEGEKSAIDKFLEKAEGKDGR